MRYFFAALTIEMRCLSLKSSFVCTALLLVLEEGSAEYDCTCFEVSVRSLLSVICVILSSRNLHIDMAEPASMVKI